MIRVTILECARTVSFQPVFPRLRRLRLGRYSSAVVVRKKSGSLKLRRSSIWKRTRCRWIGCESSVVLTSSQISVESSTGFSVTGMSQCMPLSSIIMESPFAHFVLEEQNAACFYGGRFGRPGTLAAVWTGSELDRSDGFRPATRTA